MIINIFTFDFVAKTINWKQKIVPVFKNLVLGDSLACCVFGISINLFSHSVFPSFGYFRLSSSEVPAVPTLGLVRDC